MRIIIIESLNGRTELLCASNVKALIINQTNVRKNKHAKCSGTWFMTFLNAILIKFYSILRNILLKIKDYFILSGQISKVVIILYSLEVLVICGVWLGFDDSKNRQNSYQSFLNNLSIFEGEITMNLATETAFVIVGDFNADLHKYRRFDKHFSNFLNNNS